MTGNSLCHAFRLSVSQISSTLFCHRGCCYHTSRSAMGEFVKVSRHSLLTPAALIWSLPVLLMETLQLYLRSRPKPRDHLLFLQQFLKVSYVSPVTALRYANELLAFQAQDWSVKDSAKWSFSCPDLRSTVLRKTFPKNSNLYLLI